MKTKNIITFMCLFLMAKVAASNAISLPELSSGLALYEKEIAEQKVSTEKRYYLYLLAGRELLDYDYPKYARKYFQKAINLKLKINLVEPYLKLIDVAIALDNEKQIKKSLSNLENYMKRQKDVNPRVRSYISFVRGTYLRDPSALQSMEKTFGHYTSLQSIYKSMNKGDYLKAFASFESKGLEYANVDLKVTYDLLNVLVHKGKRSKVKNLFCTESYRKYPNAYSYSVKICSILTQYLQSGSVSSKKLKDLNKYFKSNHKDKKYLLKGVTALSK